MFIALRDFERCQLAPKGVTLLFTAVLLQTQTSLLHAKRLQQLIRQFVNIPTARGQ
jgi:hypothetical protein